MNPQGIFIAGDQLRPLWRFFLSLVAVFTAFALSAETLRTACLILKVHPGEFEAEFWLEVLGLAAVLIAFKVMTATFERRPLGSMGLAFHPRWWKELGQGLGLGAAMLMLVVALEGAGGYVHFTLTPHPALEMISFALAFFAVAATCEETIFRGYPFQRLAELITPAGAVAVGSAVFGLAHLGNPHWTWVSTLNTALVGMTFCVAYLRTRSLWMPIAMHFIWNFLMGASLGLPVSGIYFSGGLLTAQVQGPVWLTGGEYGPEGSLLTTGVILMATVYLAFTKSIYTSEEMKALVFAPVPARWPEPLITIFSASPPEEVKRD